MKAREVLNRLKWGEGKLGLATIWILHRGAPNDELAIQGSDIVDMDRSFMYVRRGDQVTAIPFHRVIRIELSGRKIWAKA